MHKSPKPWSLMPFLLGLALLSGCASAPTGILKMIQSPASQRGKLAITLIKGAARSVQATLADLDNVVVTVQQEGDNPVSGTIPSGQFAEQNTASLTFGDLVSGPVSVSVSIRDKQGVVIGYAKKSTDIQAEQTATLSFDIQLFPAISNASSGTSTLTTSVSVRDGLSYLNSGNVSTLAGSALGSLDGTDALFNNPSGVTIDSKGNVFVADTLNHRIRKLSNGTVSTFAGSSQGTIDNTGTAARLSNPVGLVVDNADNLYVADAYNNRIRKISPDGAVTTFAGNTTAGYRDGTGTAATFNLPYGLAIDLDGNLYVADTSNNRIRKISPAGVVTTLAGDAAGYRDAQGTSALFNAPKGVAVDYNGNLYVADTGNHCIRKITPSGTVTTLAGSTQANYANGEGSAARFNQPRALAIDCNSNLYVTDTGNHCIRKVTYQGAVSTIAGQTKAGMRDARGREAQFNTPAGIFVDPVGKITVADTLNHRLRTIQ